MMNLVLLLVKELGLLLFKSNTKKTFVPDFVLLDGKAYLCICQLLNNTSI